MIQMIVFIQFQQISLFISLIQMVSQNGTFVMKTGYCILLLEHLLGLREIMCL